MSAPTRIKGYDEMIEALSEAGTVAGHLSDFCVRTLTENEDLRTRVALLESALQEIERIGGRGPVEIARAALSGAAQPRGEP